MSEGISLPGETAETQAIAWSERSGDGTLTMSRQHNVEQELIRDGCMDTSGQRSVSETQMRARLLEHAKLSPKMFRGWTVTPLDDGILVEYIPFSEGYVCTECEGLGHTSDPCPVCLGKGKVAPKPNWRLEDCKHCLVVGEKGLTPHVSGHLPCPKCHGSGLAEGILAVPEESQQDHSYGTIVASGQLVPDLEVGDRVLFSKHAGIYIHGEGKKRYCLLRRGEVMGYMRKS